MSDVIWPNFFIAGAPRSGTTALYEFLRQHPEVYLSPIKEPSFFARDDLMNWRWREDSLRFIEEGRAPLEKYLAGPMTERLHRQLVLEEHHYLRLFERAGGFRAVGEGSVTYFWQPGAATAIASRVPHARLIFLLRDPAERLFSQYLASLQMRPDATFRERFMAATTPENKESTWLAVGQYASNLGRFLAAFPREQVRVHLYEDYRRDPGSVLRDLFAFLEVDPDQPVNPNPRHNEPAVPRFLWIHHLRNRLIGRRRLMPLVPAPLRVLARRWYHRPRAQLRLDQADRRMVIDYYRDEITRTAEMLGRDLSAWLR